MRYFSSDASPKEAEASSIFSEADFFKDDGTVST